MTQDSTCCGKCRTWVLSIPPTIGSCKDSDCLCHSQKATWVDEESLSEKLHEIYQQEAWKQGDLRHSDLYEDLPENIKEFDRVLARFIRTNFIPLSTLHTLESVLKEKRHKEDCYCEEYGCAWTAGIDAALSEIRKLMV